MSNHNEAFGRLLKGAVGSIAAYEGKAAQVVEDELGAQIGVAGSAIQRYKAGYLSPEPRAVQVLAEAAVRRGYLSRAWLMRFLQAARYPTPDALAAQLTDALGPAVAAPRTSLPSGTLVFLFTDIEGSTTRWEHHPQAMERALARHDEILRQTIDAYGGHVVKTVGDAFQVVFTTAPDALEAALAAQRARAAESWGPIDPIRVRMALHVGSVQQRDGDYFGPLLMGLALPLERERNLDRPHARLDRWPGGADPNHIAGSSWLTGDDARGTRGCQAIPGGGSRRGAGGQRPHR